MTKELFDNIYATLVKSHQLWNDEILTHFPHCLDNFNPQYINVLKGLSEIELFNLDCKTDYSPLINTPLDFLKKVNQLTDLKKINCKSAIPIQYTKKLRPKKLHELECIKGFTEVHLKHSNIKQAFDIGGGVGHLARVLCLQNIETTIIEKDSTLLKSGHATQRKFFNELKALNYINNSFENYNSFFFPEKYNETMLIGLHTCGSLAIHTINAFIKYRFGALLNFGCCYLKLDPKTDVNISSRAKSSPLNISYEALTLAGRSNPDDLEAFRLKRQVKRFRYALHLYIYFEHGKKSFIGMGNAPKELYFKQFPDYLKYYFPQEKSSNTKINLFYKSEKIQALLTKMFLCNIIRWQFSRAIELYILLDRVQLLKESGHKPELVPLFDEKISPRNLGIWAVRN